MEYDMTKSPYYCPKCKTIHQKNYHKMTITKIKQLTSGTAPYFFSHDTLKFFGQTMKSFSVYKIDDTHYKSVAPTSLGLYTKRIFNTTTNELERCD